MQKPLVGSGRDILAVAGAKNPEAFTGIVLDLEVVPDRDQLGVALPPLAEHPLGTVGPLTRRRMPRQVKLTGGWSGSRAMVSISSGGAKSRAGRGQCEGQLSSEAGAAAATRWNDRSGTSLATGSNR